MKMQYLFQLDMLLQVSGITPGRAAALLPGILGLISIGGGWWALARSASRPGNRRLVAIASIVISIIGVTLSGTHLIRTAGSNFGTGSGRLGAIVALVLGLTSILLSAIALMRISKGATLKEKNPVS